MSGKSIPALLAVAALTASCGPAQPAPMTDAQRAQVATEIRAAADSIVVPFNRLDASHYLAQLSDVRTYVENTTVYTGPDPVTSAVKDFMANVAAVQLAWTGEPTVLVLGPDQGVITGAFHQSVTDSAGSTQVVDGVFTAVYEQVDGLWKIMVAHETFAPVADTSESN